MKPKYIVRRLGSKRYNFFCCDECKKNGVETLATHSVGVKSEEGGYNMQTLCIKHYNEFIKRMKGEEDGK